MLFFGLKFSLCLQLNSFPFPLHAPRLVSLTPRIATPLCPDEIPQKEIKKENHMNAMLSLPLLHTGRSS